MNLDPAVIGTWLPSPQALAAAVLLTLGAAIVGRVLGFAAERTVQRGGNQAFAAMLRRALSWAGLGLGLAAGLQSLGLDLSVLLGAAGVLTVAVGFASQTSASNIISGLFLVMERTVDKGDVIQVGGTLGEVLHVGLLSVRLRTFDNKLVRIPNETLMKSEITNVSRFPIRRIEVEIVLGHDADLEAAMETLRAAAEAEPLVLQEPVPRVHITGLTETGPRLVLWGWTATTNFADVRTALMRRTLAGLQVAGLPAATSRRVVVTADPTPPRG